MRYSEGRFTMYRDHYDAPMLELFSKRAPVGGYRDGVADDEWNDALGEAVAEFDFRNSVALRLLGRSGRHICIEDNPKNRRRYASLCKRAAKAAEVFWAQFRETVDA